MHDLLHPLIAQLAQRDEQSRSRQLVVHEHAGTMEIAIAGTRLINFASNDYLGLSVHPLLKERSIEFIHRYGVGSPSSRLVSGNFEAYTQVEQKLARLKETEASIILPTGYQANCTVLSALAGPRAQIALDRLCHNSLLSGTQLSRSRWFRFAHNNLSDLQARLTANRSELCERTIIVTESIFSMDGDQARLAELNAFCSQRGAWLYLDEAHATGVAGASGMGLSTDFKQTASTIVMGTFGKGLGSFGAYVACSRTVADYLINFCSGLIYSTALPPAVLGAIDAALDLVPQMADVRRKLQERGNSLRTALHHMGFNTGSSSTQIIPLITGSDASAINLARHLQKHGIYAPAIRPPTVPEDSARVRLSLSAAHTDSHIEILLSALRSWHAS